MNSKAEDVIELGVVSADTKGSVVGFADSEAGQQIELGLTDD